MDPNNNPMPNPSPVPPVPPVPPVEPAAPVAPAAPAAPVPPVAPVAPEAPVAPAAPVAEPAAPTAPVTPVTQIFETPATGAAPVPPVNPLFSPVGGGLVGATDPITVPTGPKAPDPVEAELNAPIKAAGPVPGSIGSAISMPADAAPADPGRTPSVAFNDPAVANNQAPADKPAKKKVSKNTLILLAVIAGLVVVGLAGYLIMTLMK